MNVKISVIIPMYNASLTIEKCSTSLFNQTMSEGVEFLFIDDCSSDNSVEILKKNLSYYPKLNDQTRILHNIRNLGVTDTRKRGLKEANGEYVAWVDSDDWIEPDMLEKMWGATNNGIIDVVVQNVYREVYEEDRIEKNWEWKLYSAKDPQYALALYYTNKFIPWGLPFQMSRRSLIILASQLVYNVSVTEDAMMIIYLFSMAKSCVWLEQPFYHYTSKANSNSLTHRKYQTVEEWNRQVLNIDSVTKYLRRLDRKRYRLTVNYIKWLWKNKFINVFNSSWSFWRKYKECYSDVLYFDGSTTLSFSGKMKKWLIYNIYPIYWYKVGRFTFKK